MATLYPCMLAKIERTNFSSLLIETLRLMAIRDGLNHYCAFKLYQQVIPLLSHPNQRIVDEVLFLLQYLLESVNSTVQNGLVQLKELHENPFIHTSQTMLRRAIIVFNEK